MRVYIILLIAVGLLLVAPAIAAADNNVTVVKPIAYAGSYGTGNGQIDTPLCVRVDAQDNVYILQDVHYGNGKIKSVITEYDKNLTFIRSFNVLKQSMSYQGWDPAGNGFYYDNLATTFDMDNGGKIYILCGWDIVVYDKMGKYLYQFPDNSFMSWIDNVKGSTSFFYPQGIATTSDGYVAITSGSAPENHEIIFITPDGKLYDKYDVDINDMQDIVKDNNGSLYVIQSNSDVIHEFDSWMDNETNIALNFNGTYSGSPSSLAFFSDGSMAASANGIFIYAANGSLLLQFMDNNRSANNESWGKPIAVNSSGYLIVVNGKNQSAIIPQPIEVFKYESGWIVGAQAPVQTSYTWAIEIGVLAIAVVFYGLLAYFFIIRKYM